MNALSDNHRRMRTPLLLLFGGMVILAPDPIGATLYRCLDRSGVTVFTDTPAQLTNCAAIQGTGSSTAVSPARAEPSSPARLSGPSSPPSIPTESLAAGPEGEGQASPRTESPVTMTVPIQRVGQLLVVGVKLNGSRDSRLVVDTGASHTILSYSVARDLGILPSPRATSVTVKTAGGPVQAEVVPIGAIRVGEAEAQNIMVGVFDLPDAPAGVDGLLGLTFLNHFLVTLDTVKGELSLRRRQ